MPLVSSMQLGVEWACVFEQKKGVCVRVHIIGPLFLSDVTPEMIDSFSRKLPLPMNKQLKISRELKSIPVLPATQFIPFVQMLHYCVTGQRVMFSDFRHEAEEHRMNEQEDHLEDYKKRHAGVYAAESEMFRMIEEGNVNYRSAFNNAVQRASYSNQTMTGNPVLKSQFMAITFITLASRAAIRGGLPPSTAYYLANYYEAAIAGQTNISMITGLLHEMYDNYVQRVKKNKERLEASDAINSLCDYIHLHITEELTLDKLAGLVRYSGYYLTRKFKKEVGTSLWDYINQAKVDYAKGMLADPAVTVQEVSDTLNYCSRSYFSEVFQKFTGMTPSLFRKQELKLL